MRDAKGRFTERVWVEITDEWIAEATGQTVRDVRWDARRVDFSDGEQLARYILGAKVCRTENRGGTRQ